jgi:hypothetical protein
MVTTVVQLTPKQPRNNRHTYKIAKRKRFHHYTNSIACEYHTALHARCPLNCPDRRPSKRQYKGKISAEEQITAPSTTEIIIPQSHDSDEGKGSHQLQEEEIMSVPEQSNEAKNSTVSSSNKSKKKKGRGRKYLAFACERHRLSHARCPANCIDRLKRDEELERKSSNVDFEANSSSRS